MTRAAIDRVNFFARSNTFSDALWAKALSSVTAAAAPNPLDGANTAWGFNEDGASGVHSLAQTSPIAVSQFTVWTLAVWAKASNRSFIALFPADSNFGAWFDLANGIPASRSANVLNHFMYPAGSGWYYCAATARLGAATTVQPFIDAAPSNLVNSYLGLNQQALLLYNAQLFPGWSLGQPIETAAAAVSGNGRAYKLPQNLILSSDNFVSGNWAFNGGGATVTSNVFPNPFDGAMTADLIDMPVGFVGVDLGLFQIATASTQPALQGRQYVVSVFARGVDGDVDVRVSNNRFGDKITRVTASAWSRIQSDPVLGEVAGIGAPYFRLAGGTPTRRLYFWRAMLVRDNWMGDPALPTGEFAALSDQVI